MGAPPRMSRQHYGRVRPYVQAVILGLCVRVSQLTFLMFHVVVFACVCGCRPQRPPVDRPGVK